MAAEEGPAELADNLARPPAEWRTWGMDSTGRTGQWVYGRTVDEWLYRLALQLDGWPAAGGMGATPEAESGGSAAAAPAAPFAGSPQLPAPDFSTLSFNPITEGTDHQYELDALKLHQLEPALARQRKEAALENVDAAQRIVEADREADEAGTLQGAEHARELTQAKAAADEAEAMERQITEAAAASQSWQASLQMGTFDHLKRSQGAEAPRPVVLVATDGSEHRIEHADRHSALMRGMLADADCGEAEPRVNVPAAARMVAAAAQLLNEGGNAWMEGLNRADIRAVAEVTEFLMLDGDGGQAMPALLGLAVLPCAKNAPASRKRDASGQPKASATGDEVSGGVAVNVEQFDALAKGLLGITESVSERAHSRFYSSAVDPEGDPWGSLGDVAGRELTTHLRQHSVHTINQLAELQPGVIAALAAGSFFSVNDITAAQARARARQELSKEVWSRLLSEHRSGPVTPTHVALALYDARARCVDSASSYGAEMTLKERYTAIQNATGEGRRHAWPAPASGHLTEAAPPTQHALWCDGRSAYQTLQATPEQREATVGTKLPNLDGHIQDLLTHRAGAIAVSELMCEELRAVIRKYLEPVIKSAATFAEVCGRSRLVTASDVQRSLRATASHDDKRTQPQCVYGFGPAGVWSLAAHLVLKRLVFQQRTSELSRRNQLRPDVRLSATALAVINDYAMDMLQLLVRSACQTPTHSWSHQSTDYAVVVCSVSEWAATEDVDATSEAPAADCVEVRLAIDQKLNDFDEPTGEYDACTEPISDENQPPAAFAARVVTASDILAAVRLNLPGELMKHAYKQGVEAKQKFQKSGEEAAGSALPPRTKRAGLEFNVEMVAAVAGLDHPGVILTECAAASLAGAVEYLVAEVLEIAGGAAQDLKTDIIAPRHVQLAIRGDDELDRLLRHVVIRDGPGAAFVHAAFLSHTTVDQHGEEQTTKIKDSPGDNPFDDVFAAMLDAVPGRILVDPRDGCHYALNPSWPDGDGEKRWPGEVSHRFVALPELDVASAQTAAQRQLLALRELSGSARAAFDADAVDPVRAHRHRLRRVRLVQQSYLPLICPRAFGSLVIAIGDLYRTHFDCTREAVAALQAATEHHWVALIEGCVLNARHARRVCIYPKDVQITRRMRHERA
eukprot:COSAG04_NODE_305_length_17292_cov_72.482173_2_plen_1140_part_00